jgi:hypothetical protein
MVFLTPKGFDGPLPEADWATIAGLMGVDYAVATPSDWKVTPIAGDRKVSVAAGKGIGFGVLAQTNAAHLLTIATPTVGRWWLLVCRRNWSGAGGSTSFELIGGDATTSTLPLAAPTVFPALRQNMPGVLDDQPLAWLWVNSSSTSVAVWNIARPSIGTRFAEAEKAKRQIVRRSSFTDRDSDTFEPGGWRFLMGGTLTDPKPGVYEFTIGLTVQATGPTPNSFRLRCGTSNFDPLDQPRHDIGTLAQHVKFSGQYTNNDQTGAAVPFTFEGNPGGAGVATIYTSGASIQINYLGKV